MQDHAPTTRHERGHRAALKRTLGGVVVVLLLLVTLAVQPTIGAPAATAIFWVGTVIVVVATRLRP